MMSWQTKSGPIIANIKTFFPSGANSYSQGKLLNCFLKGVKSVKMHDNKSIGHPATTTVGSSTQFEYTSEVKKIFEATGVDARGFILDPERLLLPASFQHSHDHNRLLDKAVAKLGEKATQLVIKSSNLDGVKIDGLLYHGLNHRFPSPHSTLFPKLKLNGFTFPMASMGCVGALKILQMAQKVNTRSLLATSVDVCSEYWSSGGLRGALEELFAQRNSLTHEAWFEKLRNIIVVSSLFGDGAASILFIKDHHPLISTLKMIPRIIHSYSEIIPNTSQMAKFHYGFRGMDIEISKKLPGVVSDNVVGMVHRVLEDLELDNTRQINHWIIHPGSYKIVNTLRDKLKLNDKAVEFSKQTLKEHGNCASVSIFHSLELLLKSGRVKKGDLAMVLGPGPGVEFACVVIRFD